MGMFKGFRKSKKQNREQRRNDAEESNNDTLGRSDEQNDETTTATSPRPVRSNPSFRRRLSTGSMKKLRRIGQCLRFIGDDFERRSQGNSQHGSLQNIAPQQFQSIEAPDTTETTEHRNTEPAEQNNTEQNEHTTENIPDNSNATVATSGNPQPQVKSNRYSTEI